MKKTYGTPARQMRSLCFGAALAMATVASAQGAPALVLAIGGEPETGFDPLLGWGSYGNPLFQSTLLRRDAALKTEPDLATGLQLSDDRLTWTITLRDGVFFTDGTPLDADDVAFTFNQAKAAAGALDLQVLREAVAIDPQTVRLTLDRPWITFAEAFFTLGIVPSGSYGPDYGRHPVGSGPYKMVSWDEGAQLIVSRNDEYYGAASDFAQITFLFTGEDAGLAAAQAGAVQMVAVPAQLADSVPAGFHARSVATVDNRGISLPFQSPTSIDGQTIGNSVTADPAIRRAMNMGLDRATLIDVALHGHGTPAFGPADGLPWGGADDRVDYDLPAANALLDGAGWKVGSDGVRAKGGQRAAFALHYPAGDTTRQALAETAAALLRPLGIEATPTGGSWDAIRRVMHTDPVVFGFGSHSPYQLYSLFDSRRAGVAYDNPSYYSNPQVDALFAGAQSAVGLEASYPLWSEAAAIYGVNGDNVWLWLANLDHVYLINDCLDIGTPQIEPHGHGWPITATLTQWRWTCD
ncbi:peptide/nickel transport system substrate-binding protein [Ketogulonicigenium robustum]|uniref:Peptide/nickel transport system substrate-binding protein n=1 Tax=Ketogulonicigenium robustum TaxID=92947 RepID=A0A1W6NZ03_9RHOB|nr:ABC transporter substrate-binding protein [Ketogulonicigenium robustum]ARO14475.1 peptide/nickel transport system substrate-binding protein [Ketogulonicigenium robustum]